MPPKPWTVRSSEYVIETPWLRLRRDAVALPNGTELDQYFVRESLGFAVIFALTPENNVVLVRQYKHGIGAVKLELPAGSIDRGESPEHCAMRELAEETGYASPHPFVLVRSFVTDATNSNSRFSVFLARDAVKVGEQQLDSTEEIDVELLALADLRALVRDGRFDVCAHVTAAYAVFDYLAMLG